HPGGRRPVGRGGEGVGGGGEGGLGAVAGGGGGLGGGVLLLREGDRVHQDVGAAEGLLDVGEQGVDLVVPRDVAGEDRRSRLLGRQGAHVLLQPLALVVERQTGPLAVQRLGDPPGDAPLVGDPDDQPFLPF